MRDTGPRLIKQKDRPAYAVYFKGRRVSTGTEGRAEAEQFLADFKAGLLRPASGVLSVRTLLDAYLQNRKRRLLPGAERIEWAHKQLNKVFGDKPVSVIGEEACIYYLNERLANGVKESTIRLELAALRAALKWAMTNSGGKSVKEMPSLVLPKGAPPKERWLTRDEAEQLLHGCEWQHVRMFVLLGLHTAARTSAILDLIWDRVDLSARLIDYRDPAKRATRKRRVIVPINDTLLAALLEAKEQAVTSYVVERGPGRIGTVRHAFVNACKRAGLVGVTPHTLRHTAVTWMMQKGVSVWDAAGFAGMSPAMVNEVYGKHHPDYLVNAAKALG